MLIEASSLTPGDLMVRADHGIGRFIGLKTIDAAGAPHDCVELEYAGGDKLFLPIENMDLLTRYGSDDAGAALDKLGGASWQGRKARLKKRIREMAEELIKVAALRETKPAPVFQVSDGAYTEFLARFPYDETDDQLASIEAVTEDLAKGRPMDRLICGDVGFGKTEVALRAAFVAVMEGKQVAVVVPTTLLARQHFQTFCERFRGFPVKIAQASRLVSAKDMTRMREELKNGQADIVVGTHALLAKSIEFKDLGLLIVDEEQHFGVGHKERLKQLREDVHVLTLTATPIPRTLQLALTGVREMSVIATPPVDRLAVRTFITPFDPVTLREALLRERYRGGQSFYVVPRIADLDDVAAFLREQVPEVRFMQAHGQMSPSQLEDIMAAFYDKQFDVLLSTTIVESGLDIPNANTLIVHRADMFGLAQLYQLRGRVGRSKTRAYAMFTIPPNGKITAQAEKRLKVLHSLDSLGAGFTLASHDLDLRGAGNLLGEEQSGHIKEVGYELYQSMLEEAVKSLKEHGAEDREEQWSPTINVSLPVLLPETYIPDLQVRLGLYRRLSGLHESADLENFSAELADRFGPLPEEVKHLLTVVQIKNYCRRAGISQVDAGPKGAVISFRNKRFANPQGLVKFMYDNGAAVKLQPDHKLVFRAEWNEGVERLRGARALVRELADVAEHKEPRCRKPPAGRPCRGLISASRNSRRPPHPSRRPTRRSHRLLSNCLRAASANAAGKGRLQTILFARIASAALSKAYIVDTGGYLHDQSTISWKGSTKPVKITVHVPELKWKWQEQNLELIFRVKIDNSIVNVECELEKYEHRYFVELHKRASDLITASANLAAFATGYGLIVTLDTFIDTAGTPSQIILTAPALQPLCTAYGLEDARQGDFAAIYNIVITEPALFRAINDLIAAITFPHCSTVNCGRVVDSIRRMISPTLTEGAAWQAMHHEH